MSDNSLARSDKHSEENSQRVSRILKYDHIFPYPFDVVHAAFWVSLISQAVWEKITNQGVLVLRKSKGNQGEVWNVVALKEKQTIFHVWREPQEVGVSTYFVSQGDGVNLLNTKTLIAIGFMSTPKGTLMNVMHFPHLDTSTRALQEWVEAHIMTRFNEWLEVGENPGRSFNAKSAPEEQITLARFPVFKKIKEANMNFTQEQVAVEYQRLYGEIVNADTVRNAYRLSGHEWPRGKRRKR